MADKRQVTSIRENTEVVAKQTPDYAGAVLPVAQKVYQASQETKISNNLTEAQLEINALTSQYRIDNESDPMGKNKEYNSEVQGILNKYGEGVGVLYKGQWSNSANKLIGQTKLNQQNWGVKQNATNAVNNLESTMANKVQLAYRDGQNFSTGEDMNVDIVEKYTESAKNLFDATNEYLGEESAKELSKGYKEEYMSSFIAGVSEQNPEMASKFLESDEVKNGLSEDNIKNLRDKIKKSNTRVQTNLVEGYKNDIDVVFNDNPYKFITESKRIASEGAKFREEEGMDRASYDKVVAYNKTLTTQWEKNKGRINPKTEEEYTAEENALIARDAEQVRTDAEAMNFGTKDGKDIVENKEWDDFGKLIDHRNNLTSVYNSGGFATKTTDGKKEYDSKMVKAGSVIREKIDTLYKQQYQHNWLDRQIEKVIPAYGDLADYTQDELNFRLKGFNILPWKNVDPMTTSEKLSGLVTEDMKGSPHEKTMVFESVYNRLKDEKIGYDSISRKDKDVVERLFREEKYGLLKDRRSNNGGSVAAFILSDDGVESFNPNGDMTVGEAIDNFGGYEREQHGTDELGNPIFMEVLRDKEGNPIDVKEAL